MSEKTAHGRAYARWFSDYERTRLRQKKRRGARLDDFPDPPASPAEIALALDTVGRSRFRSICGVHRSTLARWESGVCVMPRTAWLLLVLLAQGRLPGMSADWRDFRFDGDRLCLVGTRLSYSAREIAGWPYQVALAESRARQIASLQKQIAHLLTVGDFAAANDPLTCVS